MSWDKQKITPQTQVKEESHRAGLKLNIHNTKITAYSPITSWQMKKMWKQ